jgi:predicted nucleotidyltransferase
VDTPAAGSALHVEAAVLEAVALRYDLLLVVLFGSHAKGRELPRSDVDLAVLARRRAWDDLSWELDLEADLCSAMPDRNLDLTLLNGASPVLAFEVACSGKPLFESDPTAFSRFRSYAARAYYDNAHRLRRQTRYLAGLRR